MNTELESLILNPMDKARYDVNTKKTEIVKLTEASIGWMDGELIFKGETFEQITKVLERKFDVSITISNDPLRKRQFAGDFVNDEPLDQILQIMSVNGKFKYKINKKNVLIY
jgi:ferric-dicitrate binding protein FerR (iron transport regulator)